MKLSIYSTIALLSAMSANAWVFTPAQVKKAASVAAASAIIGSSLVANANIDLNGSYDDPRHPNCLREISVSGPTQALVRGTDGNPGCKPGGAGKEWALEGKIKGDSIYVDFSQKGGPKNLKGTWDGSGIKWPDGNRWNVKKDANIDVL